MTFPVSDQVANTTQLDTSRGTKVWGGPWEARDLAARAAGIRSKITRMANNIRVKKKYHTLVSESYLI